MAAEAREPTLLPAVAEAREPTPYRCRNRMLNLDRRFKDVVQEVWGSILTLKENIQHETQTAQKNRHVVAEVQTLSNECAVHSATQVTTRNDRTIGRILILEELSACFERATKVQYDCPCGSCMPVGGMLRRPPCVDFLNELALPIRCCS